MVFLLWLILWLAVGAGSGLFVIHAIALHYDVEVEYDSDMAWSITKSSILGFLSIIAAMIVVQSLNNDDDTFII